MCVSGHVHVYVSGVSRACVCEWCVTSMCVSSGVTCDE